MYIIIYVHVDASFHRNIEELQRQVQELQHRNKALNKQLESGRKKSTSQEHEIKRLLNAFEHSMNQLRSAAEHRASASQIIESLRQHNEELQSQLASELAQRPSRPDAEALIGVPMKGNESGGQSVLVRIESIENTLTVKLKRQSHYKPSPTFVCCRSKNGAVDWNRNRDPRIRRFEPSEMGRFRWRTIDSRHGW